MWKTRDQATCSRWALGRASYFLLREVAGLLWGVLAVEALRFAGDFVFALALDFTLARGVGFFPAVRPASLRSSSTLARNDVGSQA